MNHFKYVLDFLQESHRIGLETIFLFTSEGYKVPDFCWRISEIHVHDLRTALLSLGTSPESRSSRESNSLAVLNARLWMEIGNVCHSCGNGIPIYVSEEFSRQLMIANYPRSEQETINLHFTYAERLLSCAHDIGVKYSFAYIGENYMVSNSEWEQTLFDSERFIELSGYLGYNRRWNEKQAKMFPNFYTEELERKPITDRLKQISDSTENVWTYIKEICKWKLGEGNKPQSLSSNEIFG